MNIHRFTEHCIFMLFMLLMSPLLSAAEFSVTTTLDRIDIDPGDGICASEENECTLRAAVMETNALSGADIINIPANTYALLLDEAGDDTAAIRDLDIWDDLTIIGEDPTTTIITGNFNAFRVFNVLKRSDDTLPVVVFKNLTLTQGAGDGAVLYNNAIATLDQVTITNASPDRSAIINTYKLTVVDSVIKENYMGIVSEESYVLIIRDSIFENNSGGRTLYSDASSTKINNTTFSNNANMITRYRGGSGGTAYFDAGTISIENSNFVGNKASDGGAIISNGFLTITKSSFSSNETIDGAFGDIGGALFVSGTTEIIDSIFQNNVANGIGGSSSSSMESSDGGAIYSSGYLTLKRVTFLANSADHDGGAIYHDGGSISITDSVISGNSTNNYGGGIALAGSRNGKNATYLLAHSEISNNTANVGGGGVYLTRANATFNNMTISGNTASSGGGIYHAGYTTDDDVLILRNVTISNNQASLAANVGNFTDWWRSVYFGKIRLSNTIIANPIDGRNCEGGSELVSTGYNLDTDSSCNLTATGDLAGVNADLGELADNGGNTKTHALNSSSLAIDAGDPNVCINNPNLDQRYYYRNDDRCDIGAHEFGSARAQSGILAFKLAETQANEELGTAKVTVSRTEGSEGSVSVNVYTTIFSTASGRYNTYSNADFQHIEPTLEWADGDNADKTVEIPLIDDSRKEGTEYFWLKLRHANGGASLGEQVDHEVLILDDEAKPGTLALTEASISVNEQVGKAIVTILRSQGDFGTVSVDYVTQDDSAINGDDYTAVSGTITFLDGETSKSIEMDIIDDFSTEVTESFSLVLSNPIGGAVLGTTSALDISIIDNDTFPGKIAFEQANYTVNENAGTLAFSLLRTEGSDGEVKVDIYQYSGTADYNSDFTNIVGVTGLGATVTFPDGATEAKLEIAIVNNAIVEGDETFNLVLSSPQGGAVLANVDTATVTIRDDDSTDGGTNNTTVGQLSLTTTDYDIAESGGSVNIEVTRSGDRLGEASVDFTTRDGSAVSGSDYINNSGTLTFAAGQTRQTITINITDDTSLEQDENFSIILSNSKGVLLSNGATTATVNIIDNDGGAGRNDLPIDNTAGPAAVTNDEESGGGGGAIHPLIFILISMFIVFLRNRRLKAIKQ